MQSPSDLAAHRAWLVGLTGELDEGLVVDLGCGRGEDLSMLAARHRGADVQLVGVDGSPDAIAAATAALATDSRVSLSCATLTGRLPFEDASIAVVYSHNLLECMPSPAEFAREVGRVLRPSGRVVVGHWDWDSQLFDGADKALVRQLVHAYADWQQSWMARADGWMGRRLWSAFDASGAFEGGVHARVLMNTEYEPGRFGYENAQAFRALARRGLVQTADVERFLAEQLALGTAGRYFYSITGFAYVGQRAAA